MSYVPRHAFDRMHFLTWVIVGALFTAALAAAAQPDPAAPQNSNSLAEVQVTASKLPRRTLKRLAIQFVKSHGAVNPLVHQIGRWRADVCPGVTGLQPAASAFVTHRVTQIARSVGAPIHEAGKRCAVNVEIVFTPQPQQFVDHIARTWPALLGSSRSPGDATFHRAIQSWYLTGTRAAMNGWAPAVGSESMMMALQMGVDESTPPGAVAAGGVRVDPAYGEGFAGFGRPGSYFSKGLTSEILQVLIVVDSRKTARDSLSSISDYIAMLTLTRMSVLDGCSELPSITDLLSSGCADREKPRALTDTDTAYLKALYSSDLENNLNIEQGDMRDRMVTAIAGR